MTRASASLVIAAALGVAMPASGQRNAELDRLVAFALARTATIPALLDSIAIVVRRDSGSARADSVVARFRRDSHGLFRTLDSVFAATLFEVAINPDGATAYRRTQKSADASARADRDSLLAVLRSRGVWAYNPEGSMYYALSIPVLVNRVGAFVTPAGRAFLEMHALEQRIPSAADGSLMISVEALVSRIVRAEEFLDQYPEAGQSKQVTYYRDRYLSWLLYPGESMGYAAYPSGVLSAEMRRVIERLAAERSAYASGRAARELLDVLKANGYRRAAAPVQELMRKKWRALHDQTDDVFRQ